MSRFTVVEQPVAAPGHCFLCRSVAHPPFIDTGLNIMFEGAIYLCTSCLREMFGMLPVIKANQEQFLAAWRAGYNTAATRGAFMATQIERAIGAFYDVSTAHPDFSNPDISSPAIPLVEGVSQDAGEPEGSSLSADSAPVEDGEPASGEGRNGLPSDSDDGDLELGAEFEPLSDLTV